MDASQKANDLKTGSKKEIEGSPLPDVEKISPEIFDELIYPNLGASSKSIVLG
jgi:hypothetical protein